MSDEMTRIEPTLDPLAPMGVEGKETAPTPKDNRAARQVQADLVASQSELDATRGGLDAARADLDAARAELDAARAELASLQARNTDLSEQVLRAQAEMQNTRRRADDEMSKARKFAVEGFAESMLAVVDSLEAGLAIKDATPEQIREGTEVTLRQLKSALERNKVIEINPAVATRFDPHQHQAISVVPLPPDSTQEANTVVSVLQKGYLIADRVLRPALVTVAAAK
jgi:molecular chaperone GrpE